MTTVKGLHRSTAQVGDPVKLIIIRFTLTCMLFFAYLEIESCGQQSQKRHPDFPYCTHPLELLLGKPEVF